MTKTDNLELNLIEGTDIPSYAPFNENTNKIDDKFKTTDDEINSLKTSSESAISRLGIIDEEQKAQNSLITKNTNDILDLESSVEVISNNMSKVKIQEDNVVKTGTLNTVKIVTKPTYSGVTAVTPIYDYDNNTISTTERNVIAMLNTYAILDMTKLFNVTDVNDIEILSCISYAKGYYNYATKTNPTPMVADTLAVMSPSGDSNVKLSLTGCNTYIQKQTKSSLTWIPGGINTNQDGDVTIILRFIKYDKE